MVAPQATEQLLRTLLATTKNQVERQGREQDGVMRVADQGVPKHRLGFFQASIQRERHRMPATRVSQCRIQQRRLFEQRDRERKAAQLELQEALGRVSLGEVRIEAERHADCPARLANRLLQGAFAYSLSSR